MSAFLTINDRVTINLDLVERFEQNGETMHVFLRPQGGERGSATTLNYNGPDAQAIQTWRRCATLNAYPDHIESTTQQSWQPARVMAAGGGGGRGV